MQNSRTIELLAPARELATGLAAVRAGADAVYIGGPAFGARAAAGNSVEDIAALCSFAHEFGAKVHVAFNTIMDDDELQRAEKLSWELADAGADAFIIQDMGLLSCDLPPVELHASTQQDNSTPEKAEFLEKLGFSQIVLARELSIDSIKKIAAAVPKTKIECFVHGAICAGVSGRCYLSQCITGRSANRGECAQLCRVPMTLKTVSGDILAKDKYLLSLRDLNLTDSLEELMDAGVRSFKIEGRLKDAAYVTNVTAWYREKIDKILARRPEFRRSSFGTSVYGFTPDPSKSFNRGFIEYNLHGIKENYANFESPKHVGEHVGTVLRVRGRFVDIKPNPGVVMTNGDKCNFFNAAGELDGFRVSSAERNTLDTFKTVYGLQAGAKLYRNKDAEFENAVADPKSAIRRLNLDLRYEETADGFVLWGKDETGAEGKVFYYGAADRAQNSEKLKSTLENKLGKLGESCYRLKSLELLLTQNWFVPVSEINNKRRELMSLLSEKKKERIVRRERVETQDAALPENERNLGYEANARNEKAREFYKKYGAVSVCPSYEEEKKPAAALMYCKQCLRYSFGMCRRRGGTKTPEKLELVIGKKTLKLEFDCRNCRMIVRDTDI